MLLCLQRSSAELLAMIGCCDGGNVPGRIVFPEVFHT